MEEKRARELLEEELRRLDEAVAPAVASDGDRSAEGMDFGDAGSRASDAMDRDLAVGTARDRRDRVRAALRRLDNGEYGRCVVCGAQIDDERLEIRPETDRCRNHPEDDRQTPAPVEP